MFSASPHFTQKHHTTNTTNNKPGKEKQRPVHVAAVEAFGVAAGRARDKALRQEVCADVEWICLLANVDG